MTGIVNIGGQSMALPELLTYRLLRTDGDSADSFEVSFPTSRSLLPYLRKNREFLCKDGDEICFRGVIDEIETVYDMAFTTTLCGRGMAAKLMDNQVEGAEFYTLDLDTVLERYVKPYGITSISRQGSTGRLQLVSIGAGCSCYRILQGFCLHAGVPKPRFLADGTLLISAGGASYAIGEDAILSARWRLCRYGVISQQTVLDLTAARARSAQAPDLAALGVQSRQVATRSGPFTQLTERTAQQRLAAARKSLDTLELVLPGHHPAQPGDTVTVSLPAMGIAGQYTVCEVCRQFDGEAETTQLRLRAKE